MTTVAASRPAVDRAARRRVGTAFLVAAGSWLVYILLAFTLSAGYEEALVDASEATDTPVNRLPAETLAEITADHPWSNLSSLVLVLVPVLLIVATRRASAVTGERWSVRLAWLGAGVLWFYFLLNAGLAAGADSLPPLTRDLDVLTVPLVSAGSVLSVVAFMLAALGLRGVGWRPVATAIAAGLAAVLTVVGVITLVTSGFDEPVPPIALLPAELVVGIALLVGSRR